MSEEEKKAIEMTKYYQEQYRKLVKEEQKSGHVIGYGTIVDVYKSKVLNIQFILDLIEKQQKEIERTKKQNDELRYRLANLYKAINEHDKARGLILNHETQFIDKDVIRENREYFLCCLRDETFIDLDDYNKMKYGEIVVQELLEEK